MGFCMGEIIGERDWSPVCRAVVSQTQSKKKLIPADLGEICPLYVHKSYLFFFHSSSETLNVVTVIFSVLPLRSYS